MPAPKSEVLQGTLDLLVLKTLDSMGPMRSEEHTSELQSHLNLVCRLLLEKKNADTLCVIRWQTFASRPTIELRVSDSARIRASLCTPSTRLPPSHHRPEQIGAPPRPGTLH